MPNLRRREDRTQAPSRYPDLTTMRMQYIEVRDPDLPWTVNTPSGTHLYGVYRLTAAGWRLSGPHTSCYNALVSARRRHALAMHGDAECEPDPDALYVVCEVPSGTPLESPAEDLPGRVVLRIEARDLMETPGDVREGGRAAA